MDDHGEVSIRNKRDRSTSLLRTGDDMKKQKTSQEQFQDVYRLPVMKNNDHSLWETDFCQLLDARKAKALAITKENETKPHPRIDDLKKESIHLLKIFAEPENIVWLSEVIAHDQIASVCPIYDVFENGSQSRNSRIILSIRYFDAPLIIFPFAPRSDV